MRVRQDDDPSTGDEADEDPPVPRHRRLASATSLRDRPLVACKPATLVVRGRATRLTVKP